MAFVPSVQAGDAPVHVCVDFEHQHFSCWGVGFDSTGQLCYVHWTRDDDNDGDWEDSYSAIICKIVCAGVILPPSDPPGAADGTNEADSEHDWCKEPFERLLPGDLEDELPPF